MSQQSNAPMSPLPPQTQEHPGLESKMTPRPHFKAPLYKGSGKLPHRAEVSAALTKVGYRHIRLDPKGSTIAFDRPGVEIDPGGIGSNGQGEGGLRVSREL